MASWVGFVWDGPLPLFSTNFRHSIIVSSVAVLLSLPFFPPLIYHNSLTTPKVHRNIVERAN
jgi:hypothetical protein